ncbi:electron transfer flavoprotein subunit beta/FixA family protein [Opitutus sp. ER46]|uniref:electron transfer flavoprotein subunit beta/FixA family protein n=1 Tax=Opitutus sp. ER46 TaxID=2161864 RepID=UPI000D2F653F|nr:electron transfer flavoprotein subunit beta/FixA family protein [Opitutus sp. ER46]PTX91207.1 electron transfer flavoprotein subunit beta [Opitutus sp. ER46]
MKILVPLKRVPDPDTPLRLRADRSGIDLDGAKFVINPFDAIALEEALRVKERSANVEVAVVSIGSDDAIEQLRAGLGMGADRAVLIRVATPPDSLAIAKVLAAFFQREKPDVVLMGKQAIDDDSNQAGQMLAGLLRLPQATFISRLEWTPGEPRAVCRRETDAGIETVAVRLPAVLTADLRLNEPRYVSLPGIMKAKRKPLEELAVADLGVDPTPRTTIQKLELPPKRAAGIRVKTVEDLVTHLLAARG